MLAKEGRVAVLVFTLLGLALAHAVNQFVALIPWSIALTVLAVFWSPQPQSSDAPLAIVSPRGGVVRGIREAEDPWTKRVALCVSIGIPFPGIGEIFSPVDGRIVGFWTDLSPREQGEVEQTLERSIDAWLQSPTRYTLATATDAGDAVVYSLVSHSRHSRLKLNQAPGERARRSGRSAFAFLVATIEVFMPAGTRPEVAVGERVRPGQIIATLVHG